MKPGKFRGNEDGDSQEVAPTKRKPKPKGAQTQSGNNGPAPTRPK